MRELGELRISVAGLGCNNFGRRLNRKETRAVVDAALDAGINFFDTADVYGRGGSERQLGKALRGRRDRVVVATKFGIGKTGELAEAGGFRDYVRTAVEASLERLGTDWIDLYQYHRPDGVTPIAATLGALDELVGEGKLRAVGCSNFSAEQVREAADVARGAGIAGFVSLQNPYSLLEREVEAEVIPECRRRNVSVIAGATKPEQVRSNARAVCWEPSDADLAELDAIFPPERGSRD